MIGNPNVIQYVTAPMFKEEGWSAHAVSTAEPQILPENIKMLCSDFWFFLFLKDWSSGPERSGTIS